jgi:hypothetical protein
MQILRFIDKINEVNVKITEKSYGVHSHQRYQQEHLKNNCTQGHLLQVFSN